MLSLVRLKTSVALGAILLLSGCAAGFGPIGGTDTRPPGVELTGEADLRLPALGSRVSGFYAAGGKRIPLPAGEWIVIGNQITRNGARGYNTAHMLARIEGRRLMAAVEIFTNLALDNVRPGTVSARVRDSGWLTHRNCSRDDLHYVSVTANQRLGAQDCWWVNHWRMNRSGGRATEHWREAQDFLINEKVQAPLDMMGVSFRFADKRDFLTVNYFFNPAAKGFAAWNDTKWKILGWRDSAWHPDQVKRDADKQKYVQELVSWGEGWRQSVRASFKQK